MHYPLPCARDCEHLFIQRGSDYHQCHQHVSRIHFSRFIAKPNVSQCLGIRHSLHRSALPPPNLSHILDLRFLYPPLHN